MKITAPNTTHIPNVIFDYWMSRLSPGEFKILMCICRKTFGWQKESDKISRSQIVEMTGLSREGVRKSLSILEDYGLILKTEQFNTQGDNDPNLYEILVEDEKKPGVGNSVAQGGATQLPTGRPLSCPTKEIPTKETIQNIYAPASAAAQADTHSSSKQKIPYRTVCLTERMPNHPAMEQFKKCFNTPLVGICDQDHADLIAKHGESTVKQAYELLAEWKISKAEMEPKVVKKHTDIQRLRKWVIKEAKENNTSSSGYKRTGKLAIQADVSAMEEMKANPRPVNAGYEFEMKSLEEVSKRMGITVEQLKIKTFGSLEKADEYFANLKAKDEKVKR